MVFILSKIRNWLLDWVMPNFCYGCGEEGVLVCDDCLMHEIKFRVEQQCPDCKLGSEYGELCPICREKWSLDGVLVCCEKNNYLSVLVSEYKYKDMYDLSNILALSYLQKEFKRYYGIFDCVAYVPLEKRRQCWRGYNQAELLARIVAERTGLILFDGLKRTRYEKQQVGLSKEERFDNVRGVFEVDVNLEGKSVILIDDVCTTMATLDECAQELKKAGAKKVQAVVLARGL